MTATDTTGDDDGVTLAEILELVERLTMTDATGDDGVALAEMLSVEVTD